MKSKRASSGKHIRAKGGTKVKRSPTGLLLAAVGVIVVLLLVCLLYTSFHRIQ